MQSTSQSALTANIGRGILAGVAGTVVMTAFQKFIEMRITGRGDSYAPADFAERVLPVSPSTPQGRTQLNYVTHFSLGGMWGTAYGIAANAGLSGQKAVHMVFATVYTGDVILNTALGLYRPTEWSTEDWIVDLVDKYVQAQATGLIFDRLLNPAPRS